MCFGFAVHSVKRKRRKKRKSILFLIGAYNERGGGGGGKEEIQERKKKKEKEKGKRKGGYGFSSCLGKKGKEKTTKLHLRPSVLTEKGGEEKAVVI